MNSLSSINQQQAPASQSRMQSALDSLHSEVGFLEDTARALEQKLTNVLEPANATRDTQGSTAMPPLPSQVVGVIGSAELRVGAVRSRINELLDRLHL